LIGLKLRSKREAVKGKCGAITAQLSPGRFRGWIPTVDSAMQLRLFNPPRPLKERFDSAFFRSIPKEPGVYLMHDASDRIIYVGKSVNLRQRVGSYRYVHPDRDSRKTVRLVAEIRRIVWEVCESDEQARLRENELLREHKPRWNVMNTRPEHYAFFGARVNAESLALRLTKEPEPLPAERLFGAFKGITRARSVFQSLLRCFWFAEAPGRSFHEMPLELNRSRPPESCEFEWLDAAQAEAIASLLPDYFEGRSPGLLDWFAGRSLEVPDLSAFQRGLHEADLDSLLQFYRFGPKRNRRFQRRFALGDSLIAKDRIDDYLVLSPEPAEESPADKTGVGT